MLLGCIGDDFTGSGDLANTLAKGGMRTTLYSGIPKAPAGAEVDAGVVALKTRSVPAADAVAQSLAALEWLRAQGCRQIFFKYCSTFDSTPQGNIGPVADALAEALGADPVIFCPAFPGTGRSVCQGHLFVGDVPLNESGMQNHPLTPMTDSDIRRWLALQSRMTVGHVPIQVVMEGAERIAAALARQKAAGRRHVVVDAIRDADLIQIGQAARGLPLVTGGSGVALGLPANFGFSPRPVPWRGQNGPCVALAGSCSATTRAQISHHAAHHPVLEIDAEAVLSGDVTPLRIAEWALQQRGIPLVHTSADPERVAQIQRRHGRDASSAALEAFLAEVARLAVAGGACRLVSAGGETSGAIVEGLGIETLQIGPEIDPGVPALRASAALVLALKSGNFGARDFFEKAAGVLAG